MVKIIVDESMIHGEVAAGFEQVEAEFKKNFTERGELGAACAVYHKGRKVVDLWGGYADEQTRSAWEKDTLVLVFSTTKGISAMTMVVAHSQGLLDLDEPVAKYWQEFGQAGKEEITVRQLLAHQAGLSAVDEPMNVQKLADLDFVAAAIAKQKPAWKPGTKHGYHGLSLGWYQNELIRRVDPQRRSLGKFFQDEIAKPLGIEFHIGLPSDISATRLATIKGFHPLQMLLHLDKIPMGMVLSLMIPNSLVKHSLMNPKMRAPADIGNAEYRAVEFPSANGIGQARAIACAYGVFANGGNELEIKPQTMAELAAPATATPWGLRDEILKAETAYSFGFMKPTSCFLNGTSKSGFGAAGAGGSIGFADPEEQIGFSYVMNKMGFDMFDDPREKALRDACYRCVEKLQS
jgi:CubicO group peptidase (beta-lactamase class C family)